MRYREPASEGDHAGAGSRFRRGYGRLHVFKDPEEVIRQLSDGMEKWADEQQGRPESVGDALPFVRWHPVLPAVGGDEKIEVEGATPA